MPLDFPTSPVLNELYTFGGKTWKWDGAGWVSYNVGLIGPAGPTGATGPQGIQGPTGPIGDYVISVGGKTGSIGLTAGNGIEITTASNTFTITNQLYTLIDGGSY